MKQLDQQVSDLVRELKDYRVKTGLTQADIAWKLGFSVQAISRWERFACTPDIRAIGRIVDFLRRADQQMENVLIRAVTTSAESRNLWEGEDVRYLAGSRREMAETPRMQEMIGRSLRPLLMGPYREVIENPDIVRSLKAREIASIEFFGGIALTSSGNIPDDCIQIKRITFQTGPEGRIRGDTRSVLFPRSEATLSHGAIIRTWDSLLQPA